MFTFDGMVNYPCHGIEATTSYEYLSLSSATLCASTLTCLEDNKSVEDEPYMVGNRSKIMATRLLQLCDLFDEECFQSNVPTMNGFSDFAGVVFDVQLLPEDQNEIIIGNMRSKRP
ncbi:unnamed protein product [Angiostrongylus costaricensis]|uniref:NR LBD domain-containing protein n=1 Tax=Angiostrongylus costaricensis TaxID=334426 RepID=A0A158PKB0_ANGCS|nr:unnamed protein product [Angiostrongylus costaricensis]